MKLFNALFIAIPCAMGATIIIAPTVVAVTQKEPEPVPPSPTPVVYDEYLTFTAIKDGQISLTFSNDSEPAELASEPNLHYSFDGEGWLEYHWSDGVGEAIALAKGQQIMFVGDNPQGFSCTKTVTEGEIDFTTSFVMTGEFEVSGDVMSLVYTKDAIDTSIIPTPYCFYKLFENCDAITTAENMTFSAMTLTKGCYQDMFDQCDGLIFAPKILPATILAERCYRYMFEYCSKLVNPPQILGDELKKDCYYGMFKNCASLVTAPELNSTKLAEACYYSMFYNCFDLVNAPALPATDLRKNCYYNMFYKCTSLVEAPYLPATGICYQCYGSMFGGCSSLNTIKIAYTGNFPNPNLNYEFYLWVSSVAEEGTFYYNGADRTYGDSAIPEGWEVVQF